MPEEYSAGGWFRWSVPIEKHTWEVAFRITIIDEDVNQNNVFMGDKDLTVFIEE